MDSRFRTQVKRILHFVEGRRHAGGCEPLVDEHQQLVLFLGQHRYPAEQTLNNQYVLF